MKEKARELLSKGFAFPCSMCSRMWRAIDKGLDVCEVALNGMDCGGPMVGKSFPRYEGVMSRDVLVKFCFRCGAPSTKLVEPADGGLIGVCNSHLGMFDIVRENR